MSYKPRTLFRLIEEMNASLFLPHIQRSFVWDEDQMSRLFDSLMRNYPIQTLLFWRTREFILARKFMQSIEWDANLSDYYDGSKSAKDVEKTFVLDGQQRLQTLYALFNGAVRSLDNSVEREAYIDIAGGDQVSDDGLIYPVSLLEKPPDLPLFRLRDLLGKYAQKNSEEIAEEINEILDKSHKGRQEEKVERQKRVRRNCGQLLTLMREERHFWIEELDGVANHYPYKRIREIFVRVNTGGTKLNSGDLMFAAMKEDWFEVEVQIENVVEMLNNGQLEFDKDLVLKCIVVALGRGAELDPEKFTSEDGDKLMKEVKDNWEKLQNTFDQLRDFITNQLRLFGSNVIRSYNAFVPIFDYFYHNPKQSPADIALLVGYYYKSQLFNWYGRQTDGVIDVLHGFVGKQLENRFPLTAIEEHFANTRKYNTELSKEHVYENRLRFILLNLLYVETFGTSPFNVRYKGNDPHIDHIYPKSKLKNQLGLGTEEINHIGNYRLIGANENLRKRAESPDSYFSRLKKDGVPIDKHLLVKEYSDEPAKLALQPEIYRDFRDRRIEKIFGIAKKIVNPETAGA